LACELTLVRRSRRTVALPAAPSPAPWGERVKQNPELQGKQGRAGGESREGRSADLVPGGGGDERGGDGEGEGEGEEEQGEGAPRHRIGREGDQLREGREGGGASAK
jgi:hypothetical protein